MAKSNTASNAIDGTACNSVQPTTWRTIALPSLVSSILLWAAFSPLALGWLGWVAPIGWLLVIEQPNPLKRSGYCFLWLSGCLFWLLTLQGIRLAYAPLTIGWIALSLYLAIYLPLFVLVSRIFVFHWRWPLVIAAPTAWVGFELVRGYVITGFSANLLAHTQAHYLLVIQIADHFGSYGVSLVIMMVAVAAVQIYQRWNHSSLRTAIWQPALAIAVLLAVLGYGTYRVRETEHLSNVRPPLLRVALIQENAPSVFDSDSERTRLAWLSYLDATSEAGRRFKDLDLVIWPESTFTGIEPWIIDETQPQQLPAEVLNEGWTREKFSEMIYERTQAFFQKAARVRFVASGEESSSPGALAHKPGPSLLVGCDSAIITTNEIKRFNSALLIGSRDQVIQRYDKIHLVMFGEYIPLGSALAFLGRAFGFAGASAGSQPRCFEVDGVCLVPSICFESVLPHFLSWQLRVLKKQSKSPDILVNITNDSWFRGSSILDHHLACSIFASVEQRRPMLVAANGGISAWIDGAGRVQESSPRLTRHLILATPYRDNRWGLFQWISDCPAWLAACLCAAAIAHSSFLGPARK